MLCIQPVRCLESIDLGNSLLCALKFCIDGNTWARSPCTISHRLVHPTGLSWTCPPCRVDSMSNKISKSYTGCKNGSSISGSIVLQETLSRVSLHHNCHIVVLAIQHCKHYKQIVAYDDFGASLRVSLRLRTIHDISYTWSSFLDLAVFISLVSVLPGSPW